MNSSSTSLNDGRKTTAIKTAFDDSIHSIPISGTKDHHGHALGATGAWEAAISLLALRDNWLPPNLNLFATDETCDLDYIREPEGRTKQVDNILSNAFGFGGINASLLFGRV
jgi:3-oxoacyl-[acyl-carrier-protein] synthase II